MGKAQVHDELLALQLGHPAHADDLHRLLEPLAGDMFAGAFLYGITHNIDHARAGRFASLAASKVVGVFGPRLKPEEYERTLAEFLALKP